MDWNTIITGVFAIIGSYAGNVAIARRKQREQELKEAEREARQEERMKNIERKLDIHNGYAEKLGSIDKSIIAIQKDIEYLRKDTK